MLRPTRRALLVACTLLAIACSGPPAAPDASDGSMVTLCSTNAECAGGFCDGTRLCVPGAAEADARGCVTVTPACGAGEECDPELERCVPACELPDADGDGVYSIECGGSDCDDDDGNRFPGNAEVCDAAHLDEDCNPSTFGARDEDDDGYVDARCCNEDAGGTLRCGDDCDDSRASVSPEGAELCNGIDDDCDPSTFAAGEDDDGDGVADVAPDGPVVVRLVGGGRVQHAPRHGRALGPTAPEAVAVRAARAERGARHVGRGRDEQGELRAHAAGSMPAARS